MKYSIDSIATRASLLAAAATLVIVIIFSAVAVIGERNSIYDAEMIKLNSVGTAVARNLSAELMVGDAKSLEVLEAALREQYGFSVLEILGEKPSPGVKRWLFGLVPSSEAQWVGTLPGIVPERYLLLQAKFEKTGGLSSLVQLLLVCIPLFLFGAFTTLKIQKDLRRSIVEPIQQLAKDPEKWSPNSPKVAEEAITLHRLFCEFIRQRDAERDKAETLRIEASIGQMASQVAHDIRSPLAALDMVSSHLEQVPEEKRIIVRGAISRIRDIANGLLEKHRAHLKHASERSPAIIGESSLRSPTGELLSILIDSLVTEKRMQYRAHLNLEIEAPLTARSYGIFAEIEATQFKRALSNLIDNAVEAVGNKGRVVVELDSTTTSAQIRVRDNGRGIPEEILPKLMQRGETYGKEVGAGLGLYSARQTAESWGGKLEIQSKLGEGTTIVMELPRSLVPNWFVPEMALKPRSSVVILDDDSSIHQIWQGRFDSLHVRSKDIEVFHFSTAEELRMWKREHSDPETALFLVDYELIGSPETGLEIIEELGISTQSILVTSRFEERSIRQGCEKLRVKLIPKSLAGFVPMRIDDGADIPGAILVDDDNLVRELWKQAAKRSGVNLRVYAYSIDFLKEMDSLPKEIPIYIDFNLKEGQTGEAVAKKAFERGFRELWITTGYDTDKVSECAWLRGVRSKEPPWPKETVGIKEIPRLTSMHF